MQQKNSPTTTINKTSSPLNKSSEISTNSITKTDPYDRSTPISKIENELQQQHQQQQQQQQQLLNSIANENTNITYHPVGSPFPNSFTNSANQYYDYNLGFTTASAAALTNAVYNQSTFDLYQNAQKANSLNQATSNIYWNAPSTRTADYFQAPNNYSNFITMTSAADNSASKYYSNYSNYNDYQRSATNTLFSPINATNTTSPSSQFDNISNFVLKTANSSNPSNDMIKLEQAHLVDQQSSSLLASRLQTPALNSEITNATNLLYNQFNQPQPQQQQLQHQRISPASSNSLSSSTTSPLLYLNGHSEHHHHSSKYQFPYINSSPTSSLNLLANTCSSTSSSNTNRSCSDTNSDQLNDTQAIITPINSSSSGSSSSPSASDTNNNINSNNNNNNNNNSELIMKTTQSMGNTFDWMKPVKNPSNGMSIHLKLN